MNKPAKPPRTSSLKEFERFERAQEALEEALNPLQPLIEEYNAALEEVDGAVRARGISVGDFKIVREFDEYNADKLYELVGKDKFLELGGTESQIRKLSIDKTKLRSFIAAGKLPQPIIDQIQTRQRQYSTPKPLKLT
jgi:nicotinic acid mononucleotide adenylyltransferase